jgi:hypothetical protein
MSSTEDDLRQALRLLEQRAPNLDPSNLEPSNLEPFELASPSPAKPGDRDSRSPRWMMPLAAALVVALVAALLLAHDRFSGDDGRIFALSSHQVKVSLVLDATTAPADGARIKGYLRVDNRAGRPIPLAAACNGWVGVGLMSTQVTFRTMFTLKGCLEPDYLPVGITTHPIQIETRYPSCSPRSDPDATFPLCTGVSGLPPRLPAGEYTTKVVYNGVPHGFPTPPPIHVALVNP